MDTFFATLRPPEYYLESLERAAAFIARHQHGQTYPVILVSSGGTTVPLERRMVRFMDNFSGGTRGATSAEHFLRAGAAVIFLHRQYSLRPFSRHYRHADETVLEMFEAELDDQGNAVRGSDVPQVRPQYREQLLGDLRESQQYENMLLFIHFYTVADYLYLLQQLGQLLEIVGPRAILYLAAAVSDFYLPEAHLSDHKIQSDEGTLTLRLEPVPKLIRPLVIRWCPRAFVISFKLETDPALLLPKARLALHKYQHDLVIANLLEERKHRVILISRTDAPPQTIELAEGTAGEIEQFIVDRVLQMYRAKRA